MEQCGTTAIYGTIDFVSRPNQKGNGQKPNRLSPMDFRFLCDDAQGTFDITTELLADAMSYAKQHNARGAVFYINRTTTSEFTIPNVRDRNKNLRETGPLLVTSNAVQFGRFWFNDGALDGE